MEREYYQWHSRRGPWYESCAVDVLKADSPPPKDKLVFRADIKWLANGPVLKMEGRLVGDWVEQARSLITEDVLPKGLFIDLTDITYVDRQGEKLLNWFSGLGAEFVAGSVYALGICERLALPLGGKLQGSSHEKLWG